MKQITYSTIESRAWKKSLWQKTYQVPRRGLGEKEVFETVFSMARSKPELNWWWSMIYTGAPSTQARADGGIRPLALL